MSDHGCVPVGMKTHCYLLACGEGSCPFGKGKLVVLGFLVFLVCWEQDLLKGDPVCAGQFLLLALLGFKTCVSRAMWLESDPRQYGCSSAC